MAKTFDPFDAEQVQGAWPLLEELRREGPLAPIGEAMQYVTRYEECRAVLRDTTSFSNARGFKAPGVVVPPEDRILGEMDPPQHPPVRRVMVTRFTALSPEDPLSRAVQLLLADSQQDFPVVEDGAVVGLLTRRDLLSALHELGPAAPVAEVMQREVAPVAADAPLEETFQRMQTGELAAIPVLDAGRLVGLDLHRQETGQAR